MIVASLALAMGIVLLIPVRMSETPQALGLVVVVATVLIAAGCALQLSEVIGGAALAAPWRAPLIVGAWLATFGGAAWAVSRAPGSELLIVLMTAPVAVGAVGVILQPAEKRWGAATFTGLAIGLTLLLLPALLARLPST